MKLFQTLIAFALVFFSCSSPSPTAQLHQLMDDYHQEALQLYPLSATYQGDKRYNDYLPNSLSDEFIAQEKKFYSSTLEKLDSLDEESLSETDLLSKKVLAWECDINLKRLGFPTHHLPINQMWTLQLTIGQLAGGSSAQPFTSVEDYENWLKRVDDYLIWLDTAEQRMKEGIEKEIVLPKSLIKKVVPQLASIAFTDLEDHLFYGPIRKLPESFSEEDKIRLTAAYTSIVEDKVKPAYLKIHDFMKGEYMEAGRLTSGFDSYTFGKDYYDYAIQLYTTTSMSAEEIHELGLHEVARLRSEMEKVKKQVGFSGDLNGFFDHVRTLPQLVPFNDPQQVLDNFNAIHDKMKANVDLLFSLHQKQLLKCVVLKRSVKNRQVQNTAQGR